MLSLELSVADVFFRSLGLFALLPLGFDVFSVFYRVSLSALVAMSFSNFESFGQPLAFAEVLGNILLGLLIALPCALIFHAAEWFGECFDTLRGQNIGSVMDASHANAAICSQLFSAGMRAFLLMSGVLIELVRTLVKSFEYCPRSETLLVNGGVIGFKLMLLLAEMTMGMFVACLPFALTFFVMELVGGSLGKLMPGVSFTNEVFLAKLWVGFSLLCALAVADAGSSLPILATFDPRYLLER